MIIAIDFDGTLVEHEFPRIGKDVPLAFETAKELQDKGHQLILWTVRIGRELKEAVEYCQSKGVTFWGVNENPTQKYWNGSPKAYAEIFIDDAALGCPLVDNKSSIRLFVDWEKVRKHLGLTTAIK